MKKLTSIFFISIVSVIGLLVLAFYYMDLSKHQRTVYKIFFDEIVTSENIVDRFDTDNKVVYRAERLNEHHLGYPRIRSFVKLDKNNRLETEKLSYVVEGADGGERTIDYSGFSDGSFNYLLLDTPRFYNFRERLGTETFTPFFPEDIVSYLNLLEKYDFWEKGRQSFTVLIMPGEGFLPPFPSEVNIRYVEDKFITIMGSRVPVETYLVTVGQKHLAKAYLAKYGHKLLALDQYFTGETFKAVAYEKDPIERVRNFFALFPVTLKISGETVLEDLTDTDMIPLGLPRIGFASEEQFEEQKVFFRTQRAILSGTLSYPSSGDVTSTVILMPPEGLLSKARQMLMEQITEELLKEGSAVMYFAPPGVGRGKGSFASYSEETRVRDIQAAVEFIKHKQEFFSPGIVHFLTYDEGGYLALKAASSIDGEVASIILLNMPMKKYSIRPEKNIERKEAFLEVSGKEHDVFREDLISKLEAFHGSIRTSGDDFVFFMGKKLPIREFKDFLSRDPHRALKENKNHLLFFYGRDSDNYDKEILNETQKELSFEGKEIRTIIIRRLGKHMGEMREKDDKSVFIVNEDLKTAIINWTKEGFFHKKQTQETTEVAEQ